MHDSPFLPLYTGAKRPQNCLQLSCQQRDGCSGTYSIQVPQLTSAIYQTAAVRITSILWSVSAPVRRSGSLTDRVADRPLRPLVRRFTPHRGTRSAKPDGAVPQDGAPPV